MKNLHFLILVAFVLLQSCAAPLKIPSDLSKSVLLVEKLPTDVVEVNEKGKKEVKERKVGGWVSMFNRRANAKNEKVFKEYPFAYKIVSAEEVGDNIDPAKNTYFLKNGNTTTTRSVDLSSTTGGPRVKTKQKTKVVLENLTKNRKSTLAEVQGGVSGVSAKFVKQAKKIAKEKGIGKKAKKK